MRVAIAVLWLVALVAPAEGATSLDRAGMFTAAGALPVVASEIAVEVRGPYAEVVVTQTFRNDLERGVEAVYVFPVPADGNVRSLVIRTGDQTITAAVAGRAEARRAYEQAVAGGAVAALTEAERPNVLTQQVTGIAAGAEIAVELRYDAGVARGAGGWELALPLVVAPRHVPGRATGAPTTGTGSAPDTDVVDDASRVTPPVRSRGGNPARITIDLGDVDASAVEVPTHDAELARRRGRTIATIADARSDRDLIVRWATADRGGARALVERAADGAGGVVAVVVEAPRATAKQRAARRWLLAIDTSGSLAGDGVLIARAAARALLDHAGDDPVALITSADTSVAWKRGDERDELRRRIGKLAAGGAAPLAELLGAALAAADDDVAIVVVTDGLAADDASIAALVDGTAARVHAIGVGAAPNRWLLDELARRGRGAATVITAGDDAAALVADLVAAAAAPAVTPTIDWGGLAVREVAPATLPALAAGRAVVVAARVDRLADATVTVRAGAARFAVEVRGDGATATGAVARRWARARIDELLAAPPADVADQVTRLALAHDLVTPYTALVATGERVTVDGGVKTTVAIPVAMPAGMRWQAVFGPGGDALPAVDGAGAATADEEASDARAPMAPAPASGARVEGGVMSETISVHGRVILSRVWSGDVGVSTGLYARGEERGAHGALWAGAYRRVAETWRVGVSAKLQTAPGVERGVDAVAYLSARTVIVAGIMPIVGIDVGIGAALDEKGVAWRAGLRLGGWRFAPTVGVDQVVGGEEARTSVGIGLEWSF